MKKNKIILASASPRRSDILRSLGIDFIKFPVDIDESPLKGELPEHYVKRISEDKAIKASEKKRGVIISGDTIVWKDRFLGKPKNRKEAEMMLRELSGTEHYVFSGISILDNREQLKIITEISKTKVVFHDLSEEEIDFYLDTSEPMDKAGAYGIQGFGGIFIKEIHGSYYNVVGFPVDLFYKLLKRLKIEEFLIKERTTSS